MSEAEDRTHPITPAPRGAEAGGLLGPAGITTACELIQAPGSERDPALRNRWEVTKKGASCPVLTSAHMYRSTQTYTR